MAMAQEPLQLTWDAPSGCPGIDAVQERVRRIGGPTLAAGTALQAEAQITQQVDGKFRMRLVIRAGALVAERFIEANSCQDLVGATAVALSVALSSLDSPNAIDPSPAANDPSVRASEQQPQAQVSPQLASSEAPASPRRWRGLLGLPLVTLGFGPLTQPSRGLGLGAGAELNHWRFLVEGRLWASQTVTKRDLLDDYRVEVSRYALGLRGCRLIWGAKLELSPCLLLSVQHLSAQGAGPHIVSRTPTATWLATGVGLRARLNLAPWLGLIAGVDGEVHLSRPEISIDGVGSFERLGSAAATVTVGSEWIL